MDIGKQIPFKQCTILHAMLQKYQFENISHVISTIYYVRLIVQCQ